MQERKLGQRLNIIIVSEGAQDRDGNPIKCEYIKDVSDFIFGCAVSDVTALHNSETAVQSYKRVIRILYFSSYRSVSSTIHASLFLDMCNAVAVHQHSIVFWYIFQCLHLIRNNNQHSSIAIGRYS